MPQIEMNLSDYLRVIRKRKFVTLFCFFLIVASTIFYTLKQTPVYQTSSKVKIEQRKSVAEILTELVTWSLGDPLTSQANLIKSHPIMEQVAERLNLINPNTEPDERLATINAIKGQVDTEIVMDTNMIAIFVSSNDPEQATILANTVAEVYVEAHFENKKLEASNVKQFVDDQLEGYLEDLEKSENALQQFMQNNPLVTDRGITGVPRVQSDPRVIRMREENVAIELKLIELKSKFTDIHPEVSELNRRLEKAKEDLSAAIDQITIQQKELSYKEIRLAQLNRDRSIAEEMYKEFKKRQAEAQILEAEKAKDVTIVEPASVPTKPIKPNINFNIIIGVLSGLLIGMIAAFVIESLDTSIGRIDDIEELIKLPVLGIIPHISSGKGKKRRKFKPKKDKKTTEEEMRSARLITMFSPSSVVAEAYRSMRTQLDYSGMTREGNSVLITSASPNEGKTQTLVNLAGAFAQEGKKVLIVSSDFRKPLISEIFGIQKSPGLSEVLIGKLPVEEAINTFTDMLLAGLEFDQVIQSRGIENINILTSGGHTPNPAELLNFPEMSELIQKLKQQFDIVFFDTPPVLPVADASILSTKTDGVILVYQAGKTPRQALIRAKAQLENVKARILGIVINNVKAEYIHDISSYQQYQYYSYKAEEKRGKQD